MHRASNEMQSYLVMELPSCLGKLFESMGISKTLRNFECAVELWRDFKSGYFIREKRIKASWPDSFRNYTLFVGINFTIKYQGSELLNFKSNTRPKLHQDLKLLHT